MNLPESVKTIIEEFKVSGKPKKMNVKQFLYLFGCEKRTSGNCEHIDSIIKEHELLIEPGYKSVWIYSQISVSTIPKVKMHNKLKTNEKVQEIIYDPTPKLGILAAANTKPVSINKDADINLAYSLLRINDFSQLPVMSSDRKVDGIISWKSIGLAISNGKDVKLVQDCMDKNIDTLQYDMPLLDAVETVLKKEIILVKNNENVICGIVTSLDVACKFVSLSEPFLILEQIENHLRFILDGKFTKEKLNKAINILEDGKIEILADLTFGEYIRIFESEENWKLLNLKIDRKIFKDRMDTVRKIRNEVMHFSPDPISEDDREILRQTVKFLYNLQNV